MRYLKGEEILAIHSDIIDETGGSHGIRDVGLFLSIIEKPKIQFGGKELYRGIFTKAAAYLEAFARYHVFVDGNKRTAIASATLFLFLNKYEFNATNKQVENFVVRVVVKKLEISHITEWLKKNSKKSK